MTNRRYNDDEIAAIFQKAAEGPQSAPHHAAHEDGMTLAELQDIGREAGISPDAVAIAAQSLDIAPRAVEQRLFGAPISVERTIALDRRLTEAEWERLVVELREVFNARGSVRSDGSFRQWTNGNLQALLEPTATGHRLRLSTVKGNVRFSMAAGAAMLGVGVVMSLTAAVAGHLGVVAPQAIIMSLAGIGTVASGALQLPRWARLRARQMEAITARLAHETAAEDPKRLP